MAAYWDAVALSACSVGGVQPQLNIRTSSTSAPLTPALPNPAAPKRTLTHITANAAAPPPVGIKKQKTSGP
jgi:hypothetical protein